MYRSCISLFATLLIGSAAICHADIYSWTDAEGNTVYSDTSSHPKAEAANTGKNVNYYSSPEYSVSRDTHTAQSNHRESLATLEAIAEEPAAATDSEAMTEAQCQQQYLLSCDEVVNWEQYARDACGRDDRCDDPEYLERKYRPRTVAELNAIALQAGARSSQDKKKIELYLKKKYTDYCDDRAERVCATSDDSSCERKFIRQCKDPRSLRQVLAQYDNLSDSEKRQVLQQAKRLAKAENNGIVNYDALVSSLIDILVTQALMGI